MFYNTCLFNNICADGSYGHRIVKLAFNLIIMVLFFDLWLDKVSMVIIAFLLNVMFYTGLVPISDVNDSNVKPII